MELYDRFSSSLCQDGVDGGDLYWASLACIFIISVVITVLCLILARYAQERTSFGLHILVILFVCDLQYTTSLVALVDIMTSNAGMSFVLCVCSRFVDYTLSRVVKFSLWDSGLRQTVSCSLNGGLVAK